MLENQYDFNFFKPSSAYARSNTLLISSIIIIWALAVFGFHFLLKAVETPVPEKQLATFEQVWPSVIDKTATPQQLQGLAGVYLNLIGRHISLRGDENFKLCFTSTVYDLLPENERPAFLALTQKELSELKSMTSGVAANIGLEKDGILTQVLPYALVPYDGKPVDSKVLETVPGTMQKYLVHYRSVLTDTKVLGFPFHYFYTAVFLLVLFVSLCLVYCKIFDRIVEKYEMEDEEVKS
ncbi:MAG: DUF4212 domain-containing protein [Alphaproteobacteria bacterium]|nr:DUF4212 domain-containing protein [Alphaproteobacteria bacterium]